MVYAKAKDGRLRISFPEVKAGQAVICGIAVAALAEASAPSGLPAGNIGWKTADDESTTIPGVLTPGLVWHALDTDTIAKLPKAELPQDTEARPASVYQPTKQGTFIIKPGLRQEYALRFRYKNTTGNAVKARMTITDSKHTVLVDRDVTFPPTPNKFKMLSTTTGTQINAGTYRLVIEAKDIEFKNLEIQ